MTSPSRFGSAFLALSLLLSPGLSDPARAETGGGAKNQNRSGCDRGQFRVVIDVGHSAESPGAISARGVPEYDYNFKLAQKIAQSLKTAGFAKTELMVTSGGAMSSLASRVTRANALAADLFLSVHHDSVPPQFLETWEYAGVQRPYSDRFKGHSLFVSYENPNPSASLHFAQLLGDEMRTRGLQYATHYTEAFMGYKRRDLLDAQAGVYRFDALIVLRKTQMPAVLLEAGSIINRQEEEAMASPQRQSLISAAVTQAAAFYCAEHSPALSQPSSRPPRERRAARPDARPTADAVQPTAIR